MPLAPLLAEIKTTTAARGVAVDLDVPQDLIVAGDPADLSRLFRNIIDNALRYARKEIHITAQLTDSAEPRVRVDITDDGPGIPAEERERVFDRFVRLDTSREHASGSTGLGLAIVREIGTAHGGTVRVGSAPGGGASVEVRLRQRPDRESAGLDGS